MGRFDVEFGGRRPSDYRAHKFVIFEQEDGYGFRSNSFGESRVDVDEHRELLEDFEGEYDPESTVGGFLGYEAPKIVLYGQSGDFGGFHDYIDSMDESTWEEFEKEILNEFELQYGPNLSVGQVCVMER